MGRVKTVAVLGSTGSVGKNTLQIIREHPDEFRLTALAAGSDVEALSLQIEELSPERVYLREEAAARAVAARFGSRVRVFHGKEALETMVKEADADVCVAATTGTAALESVLAAIRAGRTVALANKEILVAAGHLVMAALALHPKAKLVPVDSEHSAIFQCLEGQKKNSVSKLILTGTGGPLRSVPRARFETLSIEEVINHPKWKMGKKISVDSATLMNKGLEVIEAYALFGIEPERIEVLIHPEAIVHSMVEFVDGSVLAQLGVTDMKLPICYAMAYPDRLNAPASMKLDFTKASQLHFEPPDTAKFPCLGLAVSAARQSGTAPCVLSAADEVAVGAFLEGRISFVKIPDVIESVLSRHRHIAEPDLAVIRDTQTWAEEEAHRQCQAL